ncbi:hypothetical protein AB0O57_29200 [Streptomyces sp. NPDC091201]
MGLDDEDDPRKRWWHRLQQALNRCGPPIALVANTLTVLHGVQVIAGK